MKKIILALFAISFLFIVAPQQTQAAGVCNESSNNAAEQAGTAAFNMTNSGKQGFVPCARLTKYNFKCFGRPAAGRPYEYWFVEANSRPEAIAACQASAGGYVNVYAESKATSISLPCRCELYHVFILIFNIYKFIVWVITLPLAGLMIVLGGLLILVGGAYPKLYDTGKRILFGALWGAGLVLFAWIIVGVVFFALGFSGTWWAGFPAF